MRKWRAFWIRLRGLFGSGEQGGELDAELSSHLQMHIDDNLRSGMSPKEARRQALIRLGGVEQTKQAYRERIGLPSLERLGRDALYGARVLRKNPGFATVSILVIALGIGASVALFAVVRSVLLRPLPFPHPDRLVMLYAHNPNDGDLRSPVAAGDYYDRQKSAHGFEQLAIGRWSGFNMAGDRDQLPELLDAADGSANFFPMLGVQPALGRNFSPEDDSPDASPTTLLTWAFFTRRFNADPAILGKTIRLNGRPYTVIGVLPKFFSWPNPKVQLWVPYQTDNSRENLQTHYNRNSWVAGRLKPGVSAARATQEVAAIQHQLYLQFHVNGPVAQGVISKPLVDDQVREVRGPLWALMAAASCVLLIACLNLSNLLVARSAARRKEIAIRAALGSSRLRLIREQLTESMLICCSGGVLGTLLATAATRWLLTHWVDMPRADAVHPDATVVAFAIGTTLLTGIVAGLLPAISSTRGGVLSALQDASRGAVGSASRASLRKTLLTAEVALTVVLLVGAGLLFKSFVRLRSTGLGCATHNVLTMRYFLRGQQYTTPQEIVAFHTQLLEKVRRIPGVEAAGLTDAVPGDGYYGDMEVTSPDRPALAPGEHRFALYRTADPGYFSALQIPLIKGRTFAEDERFDHDKYIVVNQEFVRTFFPNQDPIGERLKADWRTDSGELYEIVGVVADTRYEIGMPVKPMMWFPIFSGIPNLTTDLATLAVRSSIDASALATPIQKAIAQIDPDLPVSRILTMDQIVGDATATSSFSATLVLAFAGISLLLAAVGLYGVLAYLVTQRTPEIGIRMALGARREQVLRLVLLDGLRPAMIGLALGIAASALATRLIQSLLYDTNPLDATVFASTVLTLMLVAVAACALPAWRAMRIEPMRALRTE
jgi:predicted permease